MGFSLSICPEAQEQNQKMSRRQYQLKSQNIATEPWRQSERQYLQQRRRIDLNNNSQKIKNSQVKSLIDFKNAQDKSIKGHLRYKKSKDQILQQQQKKTIGLQGLPNVGNTCFLNSTIQLLFSAPKLRKRISNFHSTLSPKNFYFKFGKIFQCLEKNQNTQQKVAVLHSLVLELQKLDNSYEFRAQHDAKNFLFHILNKLQQIDSKLIGDFFALNFTEKCKCNQALSYSISEIYLLNSTVKCEQCKDFVKLILNKAPKYLIIVNDGGEIQLEKKIATQKSHQYYTIIGAVGYTGSGSSGHYVAYRKIEQSWYQISDNHLSPFKVSQFIAQNEIFQKKYGYEQKKKKENITRSMFFQKRPYYTKISLLLYEKQQNIKF